MAKEKSSEPEYRLNIFHRYDSITKQKKLVFYVRTIQEFVSFNYEILLEERIVDRVIYLKIAGLSAPSTLMPGTGPAQGKREYSNLEGVYTLNVRKLDGDTNNFRLEITPKRVRILESPKNPIVVVSTEPVIFSQHVS